MAETILKGRVGAIGPITQVGENKTDLQYLILNVPAYVDGFGDKKGRDQVWACQALGKKVAELKMTKDLEGKKVMLKCFLDSQCLEAKEAGKDPYYAINVTIFSLEVVV